MSYKIGVIRGDGIGPEIVTEAVKVLDAIAEKYGHTFNYEEILMGGCSIDATGVPLTDEAIAGRQNPRMLCLWVQLVETQPHLHGISWHQNYARRQDF